MRERGAQRDALLLAAGELAGQRIALVGEADALEQTVGGAPALGALDAEQVEAQRDELARGQLGRERALVVLVGVAERARAVVDERRGRAACADRARNAHRPADGRSRPARMRSSVLLPEPLGPKTTTSSPSSMSSDRPCSAAAAPSADG